MSELTGLIMWDNPDPAERSSRSRLWMIMIELLRRSKN
jgi:hypothetical protein